MEVATSILNVKKENCIQTFYNLETAGTNYFHVDVMDGIFVENNTVELMTEYAEYLNSITNIPLDVHLMVEDVMSFIKNFNPQKYSGFGKIADQIEVEHCLNRGLKKFEITSEASLNSHAYHYKRGKRFAPIKDKKTQNKLLEMFKTYDVNKIVELIIKYTPAGKSYNTSFLNKIPMFMPQSLIKKYIEIIKKHPLLK